MRANLSRCYHKRAPGKGIPSTVPVAMHYAFFSILVYRVDEGEHLAELGVTLRLNALYKKYFLIVGPLGQETLTFPLMAMA